jgi:hypothetical protein
MKKLLPIFSVVFILLLFYSLVLNISLTFATTDFTVVDTKCKPELVSSERDPRPAPCNICSTTDLLTPSCTTSFSVFDKIGYQKNESETIKKDWGGNVTIDPTQVKIPFVGKRNMEQELWREKINWWDIPDENVKHLWEFWEVSNASEGKYLADYFEGTNEYYRNYGNQTTLTNYQGVLRKLTPFEYQNQLKKELIARIDNGEENQIHNYKIKYLGRLCWDFPVWLTAVDFAIEKLTNFVVDKTVNKVLSFFSNLFNIENAPSLKFNPPEFNHYCFYASIEDSGIGWSITKISDYTTRIPIIGEIYQGLAELSQKIPGLIHVRLGESTEGNLKDLASHLPPEPEVEDYPKKFLRWKEEDDGYWYRLWQATPMLSREDTMGEIDPYLADEHPDDWFELEEESEEVEKTKIEAVPHLARLYEGSQIIHQILTPEGKEIEMFKSKPITKTIPPNACFVENYLLADENGDKLCLEKITGELVAWEEFPNPYYEKCHQELNSLEAKCASLSLSSPSIDAIKNCYNQLNALKKECQEEVVEGVSRAFGINLYHPYLDEIWSYSTYADSAGFFNIFRSYGQEQFEDIAAADTISYSYNAKDSSGDVSPAEGLFLFPHLGGIQKAKEWTVNQALWPYVRN